MLYWTSTKIFWKIILKNVAFIFTFFQYYSKRGSKDFKGMDTTKAAIESSKKSKGGRQRFLVLSENDVKILKRDAKVSSYFYIEKWTFKVMCEVYHRAKRDKKEAT